MPTQILESVRGPKDIFLGQRLSYAQGARELGIGNMHRVYRLADKTIILDKWLMEQQ
jgi:hypothetical protein